MDHRKSIPFYIAFVIGSVLVGVTIPRLLAMILAFLQTTTAQNMDDAAPFAYFLIFVIGPLLASGSCVMLLILYRRLTPPEHYSSGRQYHIMIAILGLVSLLMTAFITFALLCY